MPMPDYPQVPELREEDFQLISRLVKKNSGINLHSGKVELVKARLGRRMRELGLRSYGEYLERVRNDVSGEEFTAMLDALSTNVTQFFREPDHFDYLSKVIVPKLIGRPRPGPLHFWSAGCSSGEEPYSLAIALAESVPQELLGAVKILATDLSTRVLAEAATGIYDQEKLAGLPSHVVNRYFQKAQSGRKLRFQILPEIRRRVVFSRLNFMEHWPMRGPFEVIFCRNVMIYFDKQTREQLVERFWEILAEGGSLFIGHSETFSGIRHRFRYLQPTIYQKS